MRIPSGWALLAGAILSKAAVADEGSVRFSFDAMQSLALDSSSRNKTSIYGVNQGGPSIPLVISWETNDGVVLDRFELYVVDPKNDNVKILGLKPVERSHPPPTTVTTTTAFTGSPPAPGPTNNCPFFGCVDGGRQKRGPSSAVDQRQAVDFIVSSAEKRLRIDDMASLIQFEARPLYFQAYLAGNIGSSFSRAFTVLESGASQPSWTERFFTDPKPIFPDGTKPTITSPNASQPTLSGEISQPSSNGGLPTGAIAGIAVGCAIVALAIIGFLVWFFLRRRQQARDDDTLDVYRNGRTRTDELMAEKEANAGVDASPHSPYSDEGQRDSNSLHHVGTGAGATGAALVGNHKKGLSQSQSVHDRSYTPYSDRQESMARSPSTHAASIAAPSTVLGAPDSPIPSRAVPRGTLATPYAHLVEEGMTEEEIRRLEDEERALDAAIEQSTRRP